MAEYLTIGAILLLSLLSHNMTVVYATSIVLVLKLAHWTAGLDMLGAQGIQLGIVILTAAILVPVANGTVTVHTMLESFKTPVGIIAMIAGLLAALAGGSGVTLLKDTPEIVSALLIGTMAGVFFFHGIAVGPLIAGGFTYFIVTLMAHFR